MLNRDPSPEVGRHGRLGRKARPGGKLGRVDLTTGVTAKERARLFVLFLAMGLVTAMMLGGMNSVLRAFRRGPPESPPVVEPEGSYEPITITDAVRPWSADPAYFDRMVAESSPVDRAREHPEGLVALADLVSARPHAHFVADPGYGAVGGFLTPSFDELVKEPGRFRARPIEFNGTVVSADRVDTKAAFGVNLNYGFDSQWVGVFKVDGAVDAPAYVSFLFLDDRTTEPDALLGRRSKLQGVFYRLRDVVVDGRTVTTAFVLGKKIVRALHIPIVESLPADYASRIDDSTRERQTVVYDDRFFEVFGYVFGNPAARVLAEPPVPISGRDGWDRAEEIRLKPVRLTGRVLRVRYEPFEYPSEAKASLTSSDLRGGARRPTTERFSMARESDALARGWWTTYVGDPNAEGIYIVGTLEKPTGVEEGSDVAVDGVYYRRVAFLNYGTEHPGAAPPDYDPKKHGYTKGSIIFSPAGGLRELAAPKRLDVSGFQIGVAAISALVALVVAFVVIRDRRRALRLGAELRRHKSSRLRAQGVDLTKPPGGAAAPSEPQGP